MYTNSILSWYMLNPSQIHFGVARKILKCLRGTIDYGIHYRPSASAKLLGYTDSDWAGIDDNRRSTTDYALALGFGTFK